MKRILSVMLAVCLIAGVVSGCSSGNGNLTTEEPSAPTAAPTDAAGSDSGAACAGISDAYVDRIFDTAAVHEINVEISADDWADLLANPLEKTKYHVSVTVDGETLDDVSFATKGNTSLSQVASDDTTDRYSFKLNFGKYVDDQTYYGLDKLNLNNILSDATYMKDYFSYAILNAAGSPAPLTSYVSLSINGELFGLYLAVEEVGESFIARNYDDTDGQLYKPETETLGNAGDMPQGDFAGQGGFGGQAPGDLTAPDNANMPEGMEPPDDASAAPDAGGTSGAASAVSPAPSDGEAPEAPTGGQAPDGFIMPDNDGGAPQGGMGGDDSGASLKYTDDDADSYSDIFDNAETDPTDEDKARLIASLKQLGAGENLETCVDIEGVLRYFAGHNFTDSYDSYTGSMLHNYYLYETDGLMTMIGWDYNLAFGAFGGGTATELVNYPIDTPLCGASDEDRPMWSELAAVDEYMELYHGYLDELISGYFESGEFTSEIDRVYQLIRPYVEADPSAFYTAEEFDSAYETLRAFCLLRAESIRKQLDGSLPSTSDGQSADSSALVDADELSIDDMGVNGAGGGFDQNGFAGGMGGNFGGGAPAGGDIPGGDAVTGATATPAGLE